MSDHLEDVRPMFELRGRNYVVTGGAQGIGFAVTRAICEMGGNVAVMDIQDKPVDEKEWTNLSKKFGSKTVFIQTDVTKQESLNAAFAKAIQELGSLDGLVPAAGIAIDKPFIDQTWEEFTRIQEINVGVSFMNLNEIFAKAKPRSEARFLQLNWLQNISYHKRKVAASCSSPRSRAILRSPASKYRTGNVISLFGLGGGGFLFFPSDSGLSWPFEPSETITVNPSLTFNFFFEHMDISC